MAGNVLTNGDFKVLTGLRQIYAIMSPARRRQFFIVVLLMLIGAVAELSTIGAVIPFIALLAGSGGRTAKAWVTFSAHLSTQNPLTVATVTFILFATVGGLVRLQLTWSSRSFVYRLDHELSVEIQRRVLSQPYSFHTQANSSTLLASLNETEVLCFDVILPLMFAFTSAVIALCIVGVLLLIDPVTTLAVSAGFAGLYLLIVALTRHHLAASSRTLARAFHERTQVVQESLGGIREVIIDHSQAAYLRSFKSLDAELNEARAVNQFIGIAPRYLVEMGGMVVIALVAYLSVERAGGIILALPILGALALGAQRLLPLVQQVFTGWSALAGQRSVLEQVVDLLRLPYQDSPVEVVEPVCPKEAIELENVSFAYPNRSRRALEEINLCIPSGSMLAVVGETGSGKSTLLDIVMGLVRPDSGQMLIDGNLLTPSLLGSWHRAIGHVPQTIFLADATIARNIALSLPEERPDMARVIEAAKTAQLHDFVTSLPERYDTYVGERGVRLSGGQRQRLGIARAIYKQAPVLVLDEATSALDDNTETAVIASLAQLRREGRTIIIVAHRQSTIRHCDIVARLDRGRLIDVSHSDTRRKRKRSAP